ncbi:LON peptidase N-terminal domain and RING finger protein C14F5.10c [Exophiala dermatitidis]
MSADEQDKPSTTPASGSEKSPEVEAEVEVDARSIVRLFQCSQCSYPLREAMTLPCGNTLCKPCLPPIYRRGNITYPPVEGRENGFLCPFPDCGVEHSVGDCGMDVMVNKIVQLGKAQVFSRKSETSQTRLLLEEKLDMAKIVDSGMDIMPRSRVLHGGRLETTFALADMGELDYTSDVVYTPLDVDPSASSTRAHDLAILESLRELTRPELECQVCYQMMLDPVTTSCGHTFCRKCFGRAMDHSSYCPTCRRRLPRLPATLSMASNKLLNDLSRILLPDQLAARQAIHDEEERIDEQNRLPLFPCTLAFPQMLTFLHIFEPRYRLMVRRVMDSGSRKFGMLVPRGQSFSVPDGTGTPRFHPFGTVLYIERMELLPDGRSLIETRGLYKFRVLETDVYDGYLVGKVQRVDDIPIREEEMREAEETSREAVPGESEAGRIQRMSTQALLEYGLAFVERARSRSARWLHQRVLAAYGEPSTDPAVFPYWFASVLPIAEGEKYQLLPATSVRERLKITALWVERLERTRWQQSSASASSCIVL